MIILGVAITGLALVLSWLFANLACSLGLLFSGIPAAGAVFGSTAFCAAASVATALVFRRRGKHLPWAGLVAGNILLTLMAVGLLSWLQTRQQMAIFMNPVPVPSELCVHRGRSIMFSSYVHFTGPPEVIDALIRSKQLKEVLPGPTNQDDDSGFFLWLKLSAPWDWWQPAAMPNPRFFHRHHESDAIQGWGEGWWVNGATNEVYAWIGG